MDRAPTESAADATAPGATEPLLDHPALTALGLLIEAEAGLMDVVTPELETFGFSLSSFEVVLRLARSPGHRLRMAELTAQCTLTSSGLTRVVDRLESAGLVRREPCEFDRRGYFAVLTPKGRDLLSAALPDHISTIERIYLDVLEPDELQGFLVALRKIRARVAPASDPLVARTLT